MIKTSLPWRASKVSPGPHHRSGPVPGPGPAAAATSQESTRPVGTVGRHFRLVVESQRRYSIMMYHWSFQCFSPFCSPCFNFYRSFLDQNRFKKLQFFGFRPTQKLRPPGRLDGGREELSKAAHALAAVAALDQAPGREICEELVAGTEDRRRRTCGAW